MSQENVEVVRRTYEVINAIGNTGPESVDIEALAPDLWARLDPDFELHERRDLPDAKVYRGRVEAKEFWRKTQQLFAEVVWEPLDFTDLGHAIVVETRIAVIGRGSDVRVEADETDVFLAPQRDDRSPAGAPHQSRGPRGRRAAGVAITSRRVH
jgi:ketosteroid isomerase-like protein